MKYTTEIKVNSPLNAFIKKIDNIDNIKHWQRGLVSVEHISGDPGQLGAKMQLNFQFGNRNMKIIETVTRRNLPNEFHANYTTKTMHNVQENYYEKTSDGFTKWTSNSEFVPLNLTMRLMLFFMPRTFKKQSQKYMQDFKNYAENGISVTHA